MAEVRTRPVWQGSTHWRRIQRFVGAYAWMVRDAARNRLPLVVGVIALSTAAAGSQGLSVGIMGFFVDTIVQGDANTDPILGLFPRDGASLVALLAGSLFVALISNSLLAWGAARLGRRLGRSYHERVGRAVLKGFSRWLPSPVEYETRSVTMLVMRSSRILGRAVEALLSSVRLVFQALVAGAIVIATEPALSLAVAPLLLLVAPFVYRVGGKIRESSREFYDSSFQDTSVRVRALVAGVDGLQLDDRELPFATDFGRDETTTRYFDLFDDILLAGPRTVLVTSSFRSFLIVVVVSLAGYNVVNGAFSWGSLTIYVTALGYLLNNLQALAETVTKLNRFFPQLDEYQTFLRQMESRPPARGELPAEFAVRVEGQETISLAPGARMAYAPEDRLGRLSAAEALAPLATASDTPLDCWTALPFVVGTPTLLETPPHPWNDGDRSGSPMAQAQQDRLAAALSILHDLESPVALIGSEVLAEANPALRKRALEAFGDRILIIVMSSQWPEEFDLPVVVETAKGQLECVDLARYRELRAGRFNDFVLDEEDDSE